jgi:hypothetical protein
MIEGMGVGPAGSLLGAVALALVPMPVLFYYYGARLREKSTFAPTYVDFLPLKATTRRADIACTGSLPPTKTATTAKTAQKMRKLGRRMQREWKSPRR